MQTSLDGIMFLTLNADVIACTSCTKIPHKGGGGGGLVKYILHIF